jgi:WD40 repeat protein/DNA-binding SARP family transcriptional activator
MRFQLLGPLTATDGDRPIAIGGPKQRLVLAHLLLNVNQTVPADHLIDAVWGEETPETARGTLQTYVSRLRSVLGTEAIEGTTPGYRFRADPEELDTFCFESLLREARDDGPGPQEALNALDEAIGLWRGPALADLALEPSLLGEIARLEELRIAAIEERIATRLELGQHTEVIAELEAATAAHPLRERLWGQLILALYRSGRQAEALSAFDRARGILADQLGIDPSRELLNLHERVLRQEESLQVPGEALRGYRLLDKIGEGAFGSVFRAIQPQVEREVAIKAIHAELANQPDFVRRFEREAQLVARLEHPYIVPLYDYWREPDAAYLIMRFLRGGNLEDLLRDGPLDLDRAARILDQIGAGLAAAHNQGVVHRDVKPGNVLLDEEGNAYLSDFGIALETGAPEQTAGTMIRGTPAYLSPEQIRLEKTSQRSDTYALGVVLYEMLTAEHPFPGTSLNVLLDQHLNQPIPSVRQKRSTVPPAVDAAIARATAKDPQARFDDVLEFCAAYRGAVEGTGARVLIPGELRNPYKGLRAFLEADSADFFGRELITRRLIERVAETGAPRFLCVVGPSGSGKSSVVRAGLVPAIRRGVIPGSERWYVADLLPGAHPMQELERVLLGVGVDPPPSLLDDLERDELGLTRAVDRLLPDPDAELLIVLDQLEELFTMVESDAERVHVLESLRVAASDPASRVRVVATLRADFYDEPLSVRGFGDLLAARNEAITPMSPEELERAIVGPAERVGLDVEPGLVAAMVADVIDRPGALPLLQYALTELADREDVSSLTLNAYRRIGGVSGALARRAERLYDALDAEGRVACRQLFLRLITLGEGTQDTRRRMRRSELATADPVPTDAVIEAFGRHRLLSFDRDPVTREPTVEIAHEALLRAWTRLRGWVDEARDDLRTRDALAASAEGWDVAGRDESFLLRGARLETVDAWSATTSVPLTATQEQYLAASVERHDELAAAEAARRAREAALERRSLRRARALVAVLGVAALIAGSLTVIAKDQSTRASREARIAQARELAAASVANLNVDPELSILLAIEAVQTTRSTGGPVLPEAEDALHRAVTASRLELEVAGVGGLLAWSPTGGVFVTEGPEDSGLIDIRDSETGERVRSFRGHDGDVNDVAFSPDGSRLASTGEDSKLKVWDTSTWRRVSSLSGEFGAWGPSFSADGSLVAAAWDDGQVRILDLSTDRVVSTVQLDPINPSLWNPIDTALSPDGEHVAVASAWNPVGESAGAVFDVRTGEEAFTLAGTNSCCPSPRSRGVSWSPDGRLVAASSEGTAGVWDAETGTLRHTLLGHSGLVLSVAWSPDSKRLVTGSSDGTAKVWEISREGVQERWSLSAQETRSGVVGVAFSPDGTRVMAGDAGITSVKVWDLGPIGNAEWANLPAAGRPAAEFMPDGRRVVTTSSQGAHFESGRALTIWDLQTGRDLRTIGPATDFLRFLAFDVRPDGESIALGGRSIKGYLGGASAVRAWDASTGEEIYRIGHRLDVNEVTFNPDGEYLATASYDGTTKIVDRSGRVIQVLGETSGLGHFNFSDVAFSFDGSLVATAQELYAQRFRVMIWDWARGKRVLTIDADSPVPQVDFDPTGPRVVLTGSHGLAEVWDVESGERATVLAGPSGGVKDLAFSPDGSRIATASLDGEVRLFDADTGAQHLVLRGSGCAVEGVAFSRDGTKLASSSQCDGVRIWALDIDDLLEIARREAGRSLTDAECRLYLHVDRCPSG